MSQIVYDYHYGIESVQYTFLRIPKVLITEPHFRILSTDAKLLYGLMLDRMSLSIKNDWVDKNERVYIYFTLDEVCEQLGCKTDKAIKLFKELDVENGIGLIKRIKQGQGRPARIYVMKFLGLDELQTSENKKVRSLGNRDQKFRKMEENTSENPSSSTQKNRTETSEKPNQGFGKSEVKASENPSSKLQENRVQNLEKTEGNNTDINKTNMSKTDMSETKRNNTDANDIRTTHQSYLSINPSQQLPGQLFQQSPVSVIETYREQIEANIEYPLLVQRYPCDDPDEIVNLMLEVLCTQEEFIKIGGKQVYTKLAKERFLKLDYSHIEYVFDCLRSTTSDIRNIKAYLLETLFNAPATIGNYYKAKVNYDHTQHG